MQKFCIWGFLLFANFLSAHTIYVPLSAEVVNGLDKHYSALQPGDTLMLEPGTRGPIQFSNLKGDVNGYLLIINGTGACNIESKTRPYGISIRNCRYIRLTGTGVKTVNYGIRINTVEPTGAGLGISDKTSDIEVCYLEIANINGPGILCKTNPDCHTGDFIQYNTSIHNNYVHDTKTEGMYIGSTAYEGVNVKCDSGNILLMPPVLQNVQVFGNRVEYTGWDGIQISNATHVECHANKIAYDSRQELEWQNSGMVIGGGASGKFYDNVIAHGKGYGISCFGQGLVQIIHNVITMDSAINKTAIYINDKLADSTTAYQVKNNTIRTEFLPAIKLVNRKRLLPDNLKHNKIISSNKKEAIVVDLPKTGR